jgi:hypothetical protein
VVWHLNGKLTKAQWEPIISEIDRLLDLHLDGQLAADKITERTAMLEAKRQQLLREHADEIAAGVRDRRREEHQRPPRSD